MYYIADKEAREYVLLAVSLIFYSLGSLQYIVLFIIAIIVTVTIGRYMHKVENIKGRSTLLLIGISYNVCILVYYKYADFILSNLGLLGKTIEFKNPLLPLGISFFVFKAISYLMDIYKGEAVLTENYVHDALYLSFFAQVQSGPLNRYNDMVMIGTRQGEKNNIFANGVQRFLIGFNKKILLANVLANITNEIFAAPLDNYSRSYVWLGSICYSLQLFFDFSGYSDMAIGLSEMFGYKCIENFNYPYMTESVSKFWRRWHISLGSWFREYIYIPLGGSRNKNKFKVYVNLFVVWMLTGIWHGASWKFVIWGLGYFVLIAFEKATNFPDRFETVFGKTVYRVFTLLFVNFQWVIFRAEDLQSGLNYIKRMFICDANSLADSRTLFLIKDYFPFIVCAIVLCFPVVPWIGEKLKNNKSAYVFYEFVISILVVMLFVWSMSFVVTGKYNPFAYANF